MSSYQLERVDCPMYDSMTWAGAYVNICRIANWSRNDQNDWSQMIKTIGRKISVESRNGREMIKMVAKRWSRNDGREKRSRIEVVANQLNPSYSSLLSVVGEANHLVQRNGPELCMFLVQSATNIFHNRKAGLPACSS